MNNSSNSKQEQAPGKSFIDNAIQVGLIALLTIWCLYIAAPFIGPVLWGIIIAIASYPLYRWIQARLGLSDGWAATLFTLLMLVILITPTVMLSGALVDEVQVLSADLKEGTLVIPPPPESVAGWPLIGKKLSVFWTQASLDPKETLGQVEPQLKTMGRWLIKAAAGAGVGILMLVLCRCRDPDAGVLDYHRRCVPGQRRRRGSCSGNNILTPGWEERRKGHDGACA
jgi:predicted PurR-regulated permease PerM